MLAINKDTLLFGSFSKQAGNKGCMFFNAAFKEAGINAIYKSFSVDNFANAFESAKILQFAGCAVAMPFKRQAYELVNQRDDGATLCNSVNTILFNKNNTTKGFNTDFYAAKTILEPLSSSFKQLYILGNGGLATAVIAAAEKYKIINITRKNWNHITDIKNQLVINCTPVENIKIDQSNTFLDFIVGTKFGNIFHNYQAQKQFEIYCSHINNNL